MPRSSNTRSPTRFRTAARVSSTKRQSFVFTGGGTGGHVIPALAVAAELRRLAPRADIFYLGAADSIEQRLATESGFQFFPISVGKLRRYFSWQNFADLFWRFPLGIYQARQILRELRPMAVFAKGGFVSLPVGLAAASLRIPLLVHESDASLGLATRLLSRFAERLCLSFPPSTVQLARRSARQPVVTGNPIRVAGSAVAGRRFLRFANDKPIVLVTGGSTGALALNELVAQIVPTLTKKANLVWLTGAGKQPDLKLPKTGCRIFEFLGSEYPGVLAAADLVVSRAGANTLFELAAAAKPSILIPLPSSGSRGDQLLNAEYFAEREAAELALQSDLTPVGLLTRIAALLSDRQRLREMAKAANRLAPRGAATKLAKLLLEISRAGRGKK